MELADTSEKREIETMKRTEPTEVTGFQSDAEFLAIQQSVADISAKLDAYLHKSILSNNMHNANHNAPQNSPASSRPSTPATTFESNTLASASIERKPSSSNRSLTLPLIDCTVRERPSVSWFIVVKGKRPGIFDNAQAALDAVDEPSKGLWAAAYTFTEAAAMMATYQDAGVVEWL